MLDTLLGYITCNPVFTYNLPLFISNRLLIISSSQFLVWGVEFPFAWIQYEIVFLKIFRPYFLFSSHPLEMYTYKWATDDIKFIQKYFT